ncbi:hypothetical protein ABZ499_08455 [Streptomyces sp. NPDC019990]|uniref:anti-sigma factor family protein n=1 Tax=Streptomyces sp. NPDC019990 TaxID=3154693 RepID=UPI0033C029D5
MTSTTDMAGHPDVAEISDLAEGLLPPPRSSDVRRHLEACEWCADVYASLEEIRGLLGTLPGPQRMPADVAGRIDAALAAEALLNASGPETADASGPPGELRSEAQGDRDDSVTRVSRETPAVDRPAGRPRSSTTGPGRKDRTRNGRRRIAALGAVFTVAVLGLGSVLLSSLDDGGPPRDTAGKQQTPAADTFSEGNLRKQVTDLLAENQSEGAGSRTPLGAATSGTHHRVFREPTVPGCVRDGIGRKDAALAVENGRYQGKKAMLVLLPHPTDATRITAYVVDATCVDHSESTATGKILLKRSYPSA